MKQTIIAKLTSAIAEYAFLLLLFAVVFACLYWTQAQQDEELKQVQQTLQRITLKTTLIMEQ